MIKNKNNWINATRYVSPSNNDRSSSSIKNNSSTRYSNHNVDSDSDRSCFLSAAESPIMSSSGLFNVAFTTNVYHKNNNSNNIQTPYPVDRFFNNNNNNNKINTIQNSNNNNSPSSTFSTPTTNSSRRGSRRGLFVPTNSPSSSHCSGNSNSNNNNSPSSTFS